MSDISISSANGFFSKSYSASQSAKEIQDISKFSSLLESSNTRLNGDYTTGFENTFTSDADRNALPVGAAGASTEKIDKTSALYEKSLELESYLVKMMLNSMRNTISKTNLSGNENSYAQTMYEDMMYEEFANSMTKNAGFGIADQIYLELV